MTASWWQRLRDGEQRQIDRGLSRIGPPTDPDAFAVWEAMSEEHRQWARRAATEGVTAAQPEHAVVLADLLRPMVDDARRWLRWSLAITLPLVTLFMVLLVVNDFEVGTETRTIAWFLPLLLGVNPNLSTFGNYRSRRRALAANLERARLG